MYTCVRERERARARDIFGEVAAVFDRRVRDAREPKVANLHNTRTRMCTYEYTSTWMHWATADIRKNKAPIERTRNA